MSNQYLNGEILTTLVRSSVQNDHKRLTSQDMLVKPTGKVTQVVQVTGGVNYICGLAGSCLVWSWQKYLKMLLAMR